MESDDRKEAMEVINAYTDLLNLPGWKLLASEMRMAVEAETQELFKTTDPTALAKQVGKIESLRRFLEVPRRAVDAYRAHLGLDLESEE